MAGRDKIPLQGNLTKTKLVKAVSFLSGKYPKRFKN